MQIPLSGTYPVIPKNRKFSVTRFFLDTLRLKVGWEPVSSWDSKNDQNRDRGFRLSPIQGNFGQFGHPRQFCLQAVQFCFIKRRNKDRGEPVSSWDSKNAENGDKGSLCPQFNAILGNSCNLGNSVYRMGNFVKYAQRRTGFKLGLQQDWNMSI
jgi:hypothetical protein